MAKYNKITAELAEKLKAIVGEDRFYFDGSIPEDYCHDEMPIYGKRFPEAVCEVESTEEVAAIMKLCNENLIPVTPRGAGTGLVGGAVALNGGVIICTARMNKILGYDMKNLCVHTQVGVRLCDLAADAQAHGLFYPPDPGEKTATVGGNVSTTAGGMRAVKYGVTRDYVRGLTVVLPNGEIETFGGKVVKNSAGYSLKDLIVGSEGTLAVVTEAILKLVPLPKKSVSLLAPFPSIDMALEAVPEIIKSKASLTAIEFMERDTILFAEEYLGKKFPDKSGVAYLLLTVDGNMPLAVNAEIENVARLCVDMGALDAFIVDTDERKHSVWSTRGAFLEAIKASAGEMDECDVVVPRNRVADFIKYTHKIAEELAIRIPSFGHAGDGNFHVYICRDDLSKEEFEKKLAIAFERMYRKSYELRGLVSGEHGIGYAKKSFMAEQYGATQVEIMRGIKRAFDPKNILNPDKVI